MERQNYYMENVNYCPGNLINESEIQNRSNFHEENVAKTDTKNKNSVGNFPCLEDTLPTIDTS